MEHFVYKYTSGVISNVENQQYLKSAVERMRILVINFPEHNEYNLKFLKKCEEMLLLFNKKLL